MYQQITLIGNVGNEPEMRYTPSGVAVCNLSVAVSKRRTDSEGVLQEKTTWFRVTLWRRQAEIANEYVKKGSKIMIVGEVDEARPYVDRDGKQQAALEVTANELRLLDSRPQNGVVANGTHAVADVAAEIPI